MIFYNINIILIKEVTSDCIEKRMQYTRIGYFGDQILTCTTKWCCKCKIMSFLKFFWLWKVLFTKFVDNDQDISYTFPQRTVPMYCMHDDTLFCLVIWPYTLFIYFSINSIRSETCQLHFILKTYILKICIVI